MKILMIDDDDEDFIIFSLLLEQTNEYRLTWFPDAERALDSARLEPFDLFLVDYRMGSFSGIDLMRSIHEAYPDRPIILTTGLPQLDMSDVSSLYGAAFLSKRDLTLEGFQRAVDEAFALCKQVIKRNDAAGQT